MNLNMPGYQKFRQKFIELFKIVAKTSAVLYKLDLPSTNPLYPVIYISQLNSYLSSVTPILSCTPASILLEGEERYQIERLLKHRGCGHRIQYLVR